MLINKIVVLIILFCCVASSAFAAVTPASNKSNAATSSHPHKWNYNNYVMASPYLGVRSAYDASDLIVIFPSINTDVLILNQRRRMKDISYLHPVLELSGELEGEVLFRQTTRKSFDSDINLEDAELDFLALVNPWVTGLGILSYDDSSEPGVSRVQSSRIRIDDAFIVIGNLKKTNVYGTIGQFYVPFGAYTNYFITSTLPKLTFKTKARAVLLGYVKNSFKASIYGFKGDSFTGGGRTVNNGGVNVNYSKKFGGFIINVGAGYILNIADSEGMQDADGALFRIIRRVPAYDVNVLLTLGSYRLFGEYIGTTRRFAFTDLNFDGKGARVNAANVEAAYKFNMYGKPTILAIGYGRTCQALQVMLPLQSALARIGISLFKDTVESLEYRYDINYRKTDSYTKFAADGTPTTVFGSKIRHNNVITFTVTAYF